MKGKLHPSIKFLIWFVSITIGFLPDKVMAQLPQCDGNVPFYNVNLVGQPAGVWISPPHSRVGNCCSSTDNCTSFEVTLDSTAVALSFNIVSGAIPSGAMYYQIECGPATPVGSPICISGPGPHRITFCKPGNNQNTYAITSISQPTAPPNDTIRKGCNMDILALGMVDSSVTWNSIYPGAPGQYNSYLSCTSGCSSPNFNPDDNAPEYIYYQVCGNPIADECGFSLNFCDTVVIRTIERLEGSVLPSPATICASGGTLQLQGTATGGDGNYIYFWKDNSGNILGTNSSYNVTSSGSYTLEIRDGLFGPTCPAALVNVPVTAISEAIANAGADKNLCGNVTSVPLSGSISNAPGSVWIGGNGSFSPSRNSPTATYTPTAAEISSGSVTLILATTGTTGCPNTSDTVKLNFSPRLISVLATDTVPCFGQSISYGPSVSGGTSPYTYSWNTGATSSTITAFAGNYCVTVTDAQGCQVASCGQIKNPPQLTISVTKTDVSVVGGSDGSATANVSGGTAPLTYSWSNGGTTATINNLTSGTYSVTVTDANGCTITGITTTISEPSCIGFNINATSTNPLCAGSADGSATVVVVGGTLPLSYSWSNGENTSTITNLSPGVFTVTVTDSTLCQSTTSVTITDPPVLNAIGTGTDVTIVGGSNGTASVNTSGGTSPYSYTWSNGETTSLISNLTIGTYTYTVTDTNGCSVTGTVVIGEPDCSNNAISTSSTNETCKDDNNGTATVTVSYGIAPFTYLWSNGQTDSTASGLTAGSYTVIVTDSVNCVMNGSVTITEPDSLEFTTYITNVSCNGGFNGDINLNVKGGTFPYYYSWSNGTTAQDAINLTAGTYLFTVTDANGCTISDSSIVTEPLQLTYSIIKTDVTCNGGDNGAIDVTVSGGTTPYSYSWLTGETTEDLIGIAAGSYSLSVTDANNCQIVTTPSILIDQPAKLQTSSVTVDCPSPGADSTLVTVSINGGVSPYSVSFDNGVTFLPAGSYTTSLNIDSTYNVILRDSNNCLTSAPYIFNIPAGVEVVSSSVIPCITPGSSTTPVSVTANGGVAPYQISWDNGVTYDATGTYNTSLSFNGTHVVVAKDSRGCLSLPFKIIIPDSLSFSATTSIFNGKNISCNGSADGAISPVITGGAAPYTFEWTGPNGFTSNDQNIAGLSAGTYQLHVKDNNGCTYDKTITLTQPDPLTTSYTAGEYNGGYNISCNGLTNGGISGTVSGGTSPYTFVWTGPNGYTSSDMEIQNLGAGNYTGIVTDANGCTTSVTFELTEPNGITASTSTTSYNGFNVSCYNGEDGGITLSSNGGTQPYNFNWTGPNGFTSNSQNINNVKGGVYQVVITDINGCQYTVSSTLTEPDPIVLKGTSSPAACGNPVGTIDLIASGGITPYMFSWNNGINTEDPAGLAEGTYSVTVTDQNNCIAYHSIVVNKTDSLTAEAEVRMVTCHDYSDGAIDLTMLSGEAPFQYTWTNNSSDEDVSDLKSGHYTVHVMDSMGCHFLQTYVVSQPERLILTAEAYVNSLGYNISVNNGTDGKITASATGGNQPYQFTWSNGSTGYQVENLSAGVYTVECNAGGCIEKVTIELKEPSGLEMPSAFSPNGDGSNETFYVRGLEAYPDNKIIIVNRWGNEVFAQTGYKNNWEGLNSDGKQLPDGTYFVILEIKGENLVLKGYVDLRR